MSERAAAPRLFLCDCLASQRVDPASAARATGAVAEPVATHLCRSQIGRVEAALGAGARVVVACGQEAGAFADVAAALGANDRLTCVDIRDRAGWSAQGAQAAPKQAALLAEALVKTPSTPALTLNSEGVALVYGPADAAIPAAEKLADRMAITVMLPRPEDAIPPANRDIAVVTGRVVAAKGWLGAFGVQADAFAEAEPGGRGGLCFGAPRDGALSDCDVIVDLSGGAPLFAAHDKRDGYVRADPADRAGVAEALLTASGFIGAFEKPIYVSFDAGLCAHKRSGQSGCERCLDVCPTSAITSQGETVRIDPYICAGCGACAAVCPSGAATYAYPDQASIWRRLDAMARAWRGAGGKAFRLLLHDASGAALIAASARFGRGLPADVIPFALNQVTQAGHDIFLAALAMGAGEVIAHLDPRKAGEADALRGQLRLACALAAGAGLGDARARLIETADPDDLEDVLYADAAPPVSVGPITPLGGRRSVTRQAMRALGDATGTMAEVVALPGDLFPGGPPYGEIVVDTKACTLCLACVSVCPAGALLDNPDRPQLRFLEESCLQCGVCASACPESAITLAPRYLTSDAARAPRVLHEEEPFACIECGKPFGTRSVIEKISEKLVGAHWMFADDARGRLIRMCDDCRVRAQHHGATSPFRGPDRPRVRTTDDDLAARDAAGKNRKH
jgi:ferredoxin